MSLHPELPSPDVLRIRREGLVISSLTLFSRGVSGALNPSHVCPGR